jgi:hypothetical protein
MVSDDENADDLRRQLADSRDNITRDIRRMADKIRTWGDWHQMVARHPWWCAGAAVAVGYLIVPARRTILVRSSQVTDRLAPPGISPWGMLLGRLLSSASQLAIEYAAKRLSHSAEMRAAPPDSDTQND